MTSPIFHGIEHVGIVVPDLQKSLGFWRDIVGYECTEPVELVKDLMISFVKLGGHELELIMPIAPGTEQYDFLQSHPNGAVHHLCLRTPNITEAISYLESKGIKTREESPLKLDNGTLIIFVSEETTFGTLLEIFQPPQ